VIGMKKIRLEMDVPEETWRKCAVQAAEAGLTFEELVKTEWFGGMRFFDFYRSNLFKLSGFKT